MTETNPNAANAANVANAANDVDAGLFLICRAGPLCALPLDKVSEIMRPMPLEHIADLPPFVLGASIIRGIVVPVLSVARLLGNSHGGAHSPGTARFVSLKLGERRAALAVDEVIGIRRVEAASMRDMAPLLESIEHGTTREVTTLDSELLLVLQAAHLVPDAIWEAWAGQGAQP